MQDKRFGTDKSALDTRFDAQRIAFSPIVFQATRLLCKTGLLAAVETKGLDGATAEEAAETSGVSVYGARVLLECGLSADLVAWKNDRFTITKLGSFVLHDQMTAVNMAFVHDVCYLGMFRLEEAIKDGAPAGLEVFGQWKTVYEALSKLPEPVRESWLEFDHFYSDAAFPAALKAVLARSPRTLLDIGGNTGKWTLQCLTRSPELRVTLLDLPGQIEMAMKNLAARGLESRVTPCPLDVLDADAPFPGPFDAVWMSQFLVCFSEDQVLSILRRAARSVGPGGRVFILDTFWDRQRFDAAAYCIMNTSPYFTTIANGNSRMYRTEDILTLARKAGLVLDGQHDRLGIYHTLLELVPG
ncbi:class I SAM-dependent methyltransferase [Polyangium aurulentum]|uniref:class I SAM-dependent methyltransferase n=1 Tax=Polyangium aurulentum TaxID=2567896 RepID=UPI001F25A334|nr:class I SAM-dependent methyltransferase [Polyangium aurulentum]